MINEVEERQLARNRFCLWQMFITYICALLCIYINNSNCLFCLEIALSKVAATAFRIQSGEMSRAQFHANNSSDNWLNGIEKAGQFMVLRHRARRLCGSKEQLPVTVTPAATTPLQHGQHQGAAAGRPGGQQDHQPSGTRAREEEAAVVYASPDPERRSQKSQGKQQKDQSECV